jgi:hypothetical protein
MCTAGVFLGREAAVAWRWPLTSYAAEDKNQNTYAVAYATTNECYNEEFLSMKSGCYNESGGILSAYVHARAHDVSGLPAMIGALVIIFVIVCEVQLSV